MAEVIELKKRIKPNRCITIYGLLSFYGTLRAKQCARHLRRSLPSLYKKPKIYVYYDLEWKEVVKKLQEEYGPKFRRIYHLRFPVVVFFNDKYVGDHRSIIHYCIAAHQVLPDLPFPNIFPDFTDFLPKSTLKDYVYFDVRVGNLDDYVIGKMVFELDVDMVPRTCNFFKDLCQPYHERVYGSNNEKWKFSYLGSTIRRICGTSFVQGGRIDGCQLRVKDENFSVKHWKRGVLSLCNEKGDNSTTEFCISLKENEWLDGQIIAFGQMIFGEPILEAIEEVETYYERPLKDIIIVGCGVIPPYIERTPPYSVFKSKLDKEKELINESVADLRLKRIQDLKNFEQKVKSCLSEASMIDKDIDYVYLEQVSLPEKNFIEEEQETSYAITKEPKPFGQELSDYEGSSDILWDQSGFKVNVQVRDFTIQQLMNHQRSVYLGFLSKIISGFIDNLVDNIDFATKSEIMNPLDYQTRKVVRDGLDVRDLPSNELLEERYEKEFYSIPQTLKVQLVKVFNELTPSQLKLMGLESRDLLRKAGVPEETLSITTSENVLSGLIIAMSNISIGSSSYGEQFTQAFDEVSRDTIKMLLKTDLDKMREMMSGMSNS